MVEGWYSSVDPYLKQRIAHVSVNRSEKKNSSATDALLINDLLIRKITSTTIFYIVARVLLIVIVVVISIAVIFCNLVCIIQHGVLLRDIFSWRFKPGWVVRLLCSVFLDCIYAIHTVPQRGSRSVRRSLQLTAIEYTACISCGGGKWW